MAGNRHKGSIWECADQFLISHRTSRGRLRHTDAAPAFSSHHFGISTCTSKIFHLLTTCPSKARHQIPCSSTKPISIRSNSRTSRFSLRTEYECDIGKSLHSRNNMCGCQALQIDFQATPLLSLMVCVRPAVPYRTVPHLTSGWAVQVPRRFLPVSPDGP